jgi:predicted metal-dependent phosphoesterase TrpH
LLYADFHVHTRYSLDCKTPLEAIVRRCQDIGINCLAVCDHGTAEGGLRLQEIAPFTVIVAEEILTPFGEIMGMFLKQTIPSHQPVADVIAQIKAQGGLVCIPHPADSLRPSSLPAAVIREIAEQIDIVEVLNARTLVPWRQGWLKDLMRERGIASSAGSDAHSTGEIGTAYMELPEFTGREDFPAALGRGTIKGHRSSPLVHFSTTWERLKKKSLLKS